MKRSVAGITLLVTVGIIVLFWWSNGIQAVNKNDKTQKIFVVPKGQGVREIGSNLKKEGLVKDPVVFFLIVKKMGLDGKIQAGDFRLSPSMNASEIATELTHGTLDIWVTIPEGKRAEEIADLFKENLPSYNSSWRNELAKHEGYLFPDTYLIPKDLAIAQISSLLTRTFDQKYLSLSTNTKFTRQQIVILASLIEREAKFAEDRPLVASVLENRLGLGMPLQIDATIQYALGYQEKEKNWWKKNLTRDDLKMDSSYNTYLNIGLPPTPISNPGLSALNAAANPAKTNYLYYVSDKSGHNHYAETIDQHNENIRKYGL